MGGRGASGSIGASKGGSNTGGKDKDPMNVPYDQWGEMIEEDIPDPTGKYDRIGYIKDDFRYTMEPIDLPTTKKEVLQEVAAWKNDDGTYGTGDEAIYIAYDDGTFLDLTDSETGKFSRKGIIGISVSTADDEYVWGGELNKKTGNIEPWTTHENDEYGTGGKSNSHATWKTTGQYIVRTKTLWQGRKTQYGYEPTYEIIRKSAVRPIND